MPVTTTIEKQKPTLPKNTLIFHIDYIDPDTSLRYGGDFHAKRLTIGDLRQVAIRRAQLNGGLPEDVIDRPTRFLNSMLAHLEVSILKAPDWWNPESMYDGTLVSEIYGKVMEWEDSFRSPVPEKAPEATTNSESVAA